LEMLFWNMDIILYLNYIHDLYEII
jgi:hypothetical protein